MKGKEIRKEKPAAGSLEVDLSSSDPNLADTMEIKYYIFMRRLIGVYSAYMVHYVE